MFMVILTLRPASSAASQRPDAFLIIVIRKIEPQLLFAGQGKSLPCFRLASLHLAQDGYSSHSRIGHAIDRGGKSPILNGCWSRRSRHAMQQCANQCGPAAAQTSSVRMYTSK